MMGRNILRGVRGLMNTKKQFSLAVALVFILAFSTAAWADSYHYKNLIVGDRASGMGGAYTAISDDPSGLYYNPAGIVYSQGTNVSASANASRQAAIFSPKEFASR